MKHGCVNDLVDAQFYYVCNDCGETKLYGGEREDPGYCRRCRNQNLRLENSADIKQWVFKEYKTHEEYMTNKD